MLKTRFNKDPPKEDQFKDLLVFGYSSKLFRDDEKAIEIDRGRHLIPWMGDETLLIDRYDGRGHLDDCRLFTLDSVFESIMTEEEKAREKELDEERYMDLYIDVEQKLLNEEEEMKRARESEIRYGAVSFQYEDGDQEPEEESKQQEADERPDECNDEFEAFVPHEGLNLPPGMVAPRTMKHHKIIEKTALFISKQSLQMEILVKTRQKDNPAFNFLNFDDPLYAYYKHMLAEMKQGRYVPQLDKEEEEVKKDEPQHVEIHISSQEFLKSVEEKLPPRLVRDTCYDKLLNNLRKHIPVQPPAPPPPPVEVAKEETPPPEDTVAAVVEAPLVTNEADKSAIVPPPPDKKFLIDKMATYVAKNGPDFEVVVTMKNDPRFDFIAEGHVWHNYYKMRKAIIEKEMKLSRPANNVRPAERSPEKVKVTKTELKSISFSIKAKEAMEKVTVQNILGDEEAGADKDGESDLAEQSAIDPCHQSPVDIQISGTREPQPVIQVLPVQAPVMPTNNGDSSTKNKRSHSPDPVTIHKKQKSASRSPERVPKITLPEDIPKYQIPIYGPKTHLTMFEPRPPSPVYGPDLPPKEFLYKLVSQGAGLQQTTNPSSKIPPRDAKQSCAKASLTNGLAERSGRSRESSLRISDRRRSRSRSRRSSRSRRRRSPEKRRSRSRRRSRSLGKRRDRSKSPLPRRSGSRSTKRFKSPETERRRSPSRSKSRESRRKSTKKSKHHKRHHKHHHRKRDEKSDKLVVLDLTSEDVVDLTED